MMSSIHWLMWHKEQILWFCSIFDILGAIIGTTFGMKERDTKQKRQRHPKHRMCRFWSEKEIRMVKQPSNGSGGEEHNEPVANIGSF